MAPELVAEFIPLLCAAAVFAAALLVHFVDPLYGAQQAQALSATLGLASVASIVTYVVFRHGKLIRRSKSGGGTVDGRAVFSAIAIAVLVVSSLLLLLGAGDRYNTPFLSLWLGTSALLIFGAANLYDAWSRAIQIRAASGHLRRCQPGRRGGENTARERVG